MAPDPHPSAEQAHAALERRVTDLAADVDRLQLVLSLLVQMMPPAPLPLPVPVTAVTLQ